MIAGRRGNGGVDRQYAVCALRIRCCRVCRPVRRCSGRQPGHIQRYRLGKAVQCCQRGGVRSAFSLSKGTTRWRHRQGEIGRSQHGQGYHLAVAQRPASSGHSQGIHADGGRRAYLHYQITSAIRRHWVDRPIAGRSGGQPGHVQRHRVGKATNAGEDSGKRNQPALEHFLRARGHSKLKVFTGSCYNNPAGRPNVAGQKKGILPGQVKGVSI